MKNKKHKSIRKWVVISFMITFLMSLAISSAIGLRTAYKDVMREGESRARSCGEITSYFLRYWDSGNLGETADEYSYMTARMLTRNYCMGFQLDYLYAYRIDVASGKRKYVFCSSADEEKDERAQGFVNGNASIDYLLPEEMAILNGDLSIQHIYLRNQYGNETTWLVPYLDEEGKLKAFIGMDFSMESEKRMIMRAFALNVLAIFFSLSFGLAVLLALIGRRIIKPINAAYESMICFASSGEHGKKFAFDSTGKDEIERIVLAFEKMKGDINAYLGNIDALTREKLETDVQIDVARRIQNGLVPETMTKNGETFSVSALTRPAKLVGGDFYDCFARGANEVCVMIGDISGKGISAAMFMAMTKTMMREKLMAGLSPADALNQANAELCAANPEGLFATVFAAVFDLSEGEMVFSNAGHTPPIAFVDDVSLMELDSGMALGLFDDFAFENHTMDFPAGYGMLVYTDGVTEATNPNREFFGSGRLMDSLRGVKPDENAASEAVYRVRNAVEIFCQGSEPFDDMAVLAFFSFADAPQKRAVGDSKWVGLPVSLASFDIVKGAIIDVAGDNVATKRVLLACDETIANVVRYSEATSFKFACGVKNGILEVIFSDDGIPFDPTSYKSDSKEFEFLDQGGMGIGIMLQSCSDMEYKREDNSNMLVLRFELDV
ncbi:MAG TPA: hypothetical protein DCO86_02480 [Spirochaetaceae bacterium]|nr:hypothetical protein [Spirochaetaceae bacterium]